MALRRTTRLAQLAAVLGVETLRIDAFGSGWPALCRVRTESGDLSIALHIGPVIKTHRGYDDRERRIENPGKERPVQSPVGSVPIIVGVWGEHATPVLVAFDARRRVNQDTRKSMFVRLSQLEQAAALGWVGATSASGETIYAFTPPMLPAYVEMIWTGVELPTLDVSNVLAAAGVTDAAEASPIERARRAASVLVRSAGFGRRVVEAYEGRCALRGINSGLVEGAHVYPAEAPGSTDEIWNGLALCANHHSAFDRHLVWIGPKSRKVRVHQVLQDAASQNEACRAFISGTFPEVRSSASGAGPRNDMFKKRYQFYEGLYTWAESPT